MARRKSELFNLSLLDLLTSALGAVIFLFIITPKNGQPAAAVQQALIYLDTTEMKLYGDLADSLRYKQAGDTLFALVLDHKPLPKVEKPKAQKPQEKRPEVVYQPPVAKPVPSPKPIPKEEPKPTKVEKPAPKPTTKPTTSPAKESPKPADYRGDAPSVPCNLSIEISWPNKAENVDLTVCKGSKCVFGGRKKDRNIGQWDSGRSRNRLFGNDLRTNQEAVRQFDEIIPGEYKIYAEFKESNRGRSNVTIKGLIYTKGAKDQERGKAFTRRLTVGQERQLIGTLTLKADGSFQLKTQ